MLDPYNTNSRQPTAAFRERILHSRSLDSNMRGSIIALLFTVTLSAQELPVVSNVEHQPLAAQVLRLIEALQVVGEPLPDNEASELRKLADAASGKTAVARIQQILDRHCLDGVNINPESRVKAQEGPAKPELVEQGWRTFLVKVQNEAGITPVLSVDSPNSGKLAGTPEGQVNRRFLDRKSTRLNSSHRCISYAVFCLK